MFFKKRLDSIIAPFFVPTGVTGSEVGVHRLQFVRESVAKVISESGCLRVIDVGAVDDIGVFRVVIEYQKTLVVRSDRGIHIVRHSESFSAAVSGLMTSEIRQHRVFSSRVDHQEQFRIQIIE